MRWYEPLPFPRARRTSRLAESNREDHVVGYGYEVETSVGVYLGRGLLVSVWSLCLSLQKGDRILPAIQGSE